MNRQETQPDDLVRLADLEWLDLSDLVRIDEDWRRTLVAVSRLHLAMIAVLAVLVVGYTLFAHPFGIVELGVAGGVVLCVGVMAYLVLSVPNTPSRQLANLRFVVLVSILAVSLMVFLLRDLQGDYYLLYLLPLVSAAAYLGFAGGLFAGIASAVAYAVVFFLSPVAFAPGSISALVLRALIFVLVASLLGLIAERHLSLLNALRASHTQAIQLAVTDTKTGVFNQRYLQSRLGSEISKAQRSDTPVAFLVVDVDKLDRINREQGYSTGDAVLRAIAKIIQKQLRATDIASRWGVDEFGALLYNSDASGAASVARRIADAVSQLSFTNPTTGVPFAVAVAEGIATFPASTRDVSGAELVDRAYEAMQRAKAGNMIVVWS